MTLYAGWVGKHREGGGSECGGSSKKASGRTKKKKVFITTVGKGVTGGPPTRTGIFWKKRTNWIENRN